MRELLKKWTSISLIKRIIVGLIIGGTLAYIAPEKLSGIVLLGDLFVGALKSIAPVLVFVLVMAAILQHQKGQKTNMKSIISLYLFGTFIASVVAVVGSFVYPVELVLKAGENSIVPPENIYGVLKGLLMNLVDNPVNALLRGNYIGILFWSITFGFFLREATENTKKVIIEISEVVLNTVKFVIEFAPFGIMGLIFNSMRTSGIASLLVYGKLIVLLLACMFFTAFVVNPIITYIMIRQNPYPLVLKCTRESGITAFFTRSSAANIPVNMDLCDRLGLDKEVYSVSIPLGATINMGGAAITISVFALSAAHTLGIQVDFFSAILLSVLSAISACGASGVAGGSLLLIPLACSLFGIPNDIAMQVVGVGFIIGVIQDSCETALNSSTDVLFTSIAEFSNWRKEGKEIVIK
ncbi:MAG: serine/threonine transporter SstT [Fusobacterium perfoetens]|uniref:serine/threonine transporter SstT n=1 Tax=Fusobacterium perfoetens TaxID=852 RepID=UPI0023F391C3|nr:serine/threonine transporter SstT [Fusobacterium perfoetens]MCI6152478.1 serine/threonine transporter SstT [Fusobacterium perfoetens]MDY3238205.1 serine/threonine transporter SstT [Fusobacterium perfoetens]